MRRFYWSESRLAALVRGLKPERYEQVDDIFESIRKRPRQKSIREKIADDVFDIIQDIVYWPTDKLYDMKYYIVNRWVDQSHALVSHKKHIRPGAWLDLCDRILYCMFDELTDFVEIEKTNMNFQWYEENVRRLRWYQKGWFKTRTIRSRSAGLQYLKWEMTLTNEDWALEGQSITKTRQALDAEVIYDLYIWWNDIRPNRKDPMDESGFTEYFGTKDRAGYNRREISEKLSKIEEKYYSEDQEMLKKLIDVRSSLWT